VLANERLKRQGTLDGRNIHKKDPREAKIYGEERDHPPPIAYINSKPIQLNTGQRQAFKFLAAGLRTHSYNIGRNYC